MSTLQVFILVDDFYLTDQNISHIFSHSLVNANTDKSHGIRGVILFVYSRSFIRNDFEKGKDAKMLS